MGQKQKEWIYKLLSMVKSLYDVEKIPWTLIKVPGIFFKVFSLAIFKIFWHDI